MIEPAVEDSVKHERGVAVVYTLVTLVVLLSFAALTIDIGYLQVVRGNAQHTADAAALAAASALIDEAPDSLYERAMTRINQNRLAGASLSSDEIIEIGSWDTVTKTFTPLDFADADKAYAVRVVDLRIDVPLFFAAVMGRNKTRTGAVAVALGSKPCKGIWGINGVKVPGSVEVDSYNSEDGPYSVVTAGDNGDVCSGKDIVVSGKTIINGDVMPGFGYATTTNGGALEITGTTTVSNQGVTAPVVTVDEAMLSNDNDTITLTDKGNDPFSSGLNMSLTANDNLTLQPGLYYFESMSFTSGASLTITGPTEIYLSGDLNVTGTGTINTTLNPADLTIYSTGSTVKMTGDVEFYGAIIAPYAEVELAGTSSYYGAIIGGTVKISGDFEFHVDESLDDVFGLFTPPPPTLVK